MWVRVGALVFAAAAAALASRRRAAAERKHREQEEQEREEQEEKEKEQREREEKDREWEREKDEERVKQEEEEEKNRLYQYLSSLLPPPLSPPGPPRLPPQTTDTKPTSPPVPPPIPQPLTPPYTLLPPSPSPPPRHPSPPPLHPASPPPRPQPSPPLHLSSPPPLPSLPFSPLPSLPSLPPLLPPEQQLSFLQRDPKPHHNNNNHSNNHHTPPQQQLQQSPPQLRFFNDEQEVSGPFSPPPEPETSSSLQPKQLTFDASNHCLDNNENFSPDGRFLVYDTRPDDAHIANCTTIEQVEIATQKITILYRAPNPVPDAGPGVGAVSYHPIDNKIVFIHGPNVTGRGGTRYKYAKTHRFGMLMSTETPGVAANIDARDVVPPFTPGAHRGGTHRHEFDGSSQWIGWTYNDAYMATLGQDLRTIGVTKLGQQVRVPDGPGNRSGLGFSAIVVKVATDDSWVGFNGYIVGDADGSHFRRQRARAFIGSTRSSSGDVLREVFIVDIPDDITRPSSLNGPMQGTMEGMPGTPMGCRQRRISFTEHKPFPGCRGIVRSHPKGHWVSFLARSDDDGTWQVFLVRPQPGMWTPHQLSHHRLVSICAVRSSPRYGLHSPLTPSSPSSSPPYAHVISRDGSMIAYNKDVAGVDGVRRRQIYIVPYDEGEDGLPNNSVGAEEEGEYVHREESQSGIGFSPSFALDENFEDDDGEGEDDGEEEEEEDDQLDGGAVVNAAPVLLHACMNTISQLGSATLKQH
eukprot:jgi/Chlat1/3556/Chrsp234S03586